MANEITLAPDQNLTTAPNQLIASKPEELLLIELEQMQKANLTNKRARKIQKIKENFLGYYLYLAHSHYGLSREQVANLSDTKRIALANLLFKKVKHMAIFQMVLLFALIPLEDGFLMRSFYYRKHLCYLKSMYGEENWFQQLNS